MIILNALGVYSGGAFIKKKEKLHFSIQDAQQIFPYFCYKILKKIP